MSLSTWNGPMVTDTSQMPSLLAQEKENRMLQRVCYFLEISLIIFGALWLTSTAHASTGAGIRPLIDPIMQVKVTVQILAGAIGVILLIASVPTFMRSEGLGLMLLFSAIFA